MSRASCAEESEAKRQQTSHPSSWSVTPTSRALVKTDCVIMAAVQQLSADDVGSSLLAADAGGTLLTADAQTPLPTETIYRMLTDDRFQPGNRPELFDEAKGQYLFKEGTEPRRRSGTDVWRHSGGLAVSQDIPTHRPILRRRYGSVRLAGPSASGVASCRYKYRRYNVLIPGTIQDGSASGRLSESKDVTLFQILPSGSDEPATAAAHPACSTSVELHSCNPSSDSLAQSFDDGYEYGFKAGVAASNSFSLVAKQHMSDSTPSAHGTMLVAGGCACGRGSGCGCAARWDRAD